MNHTLKKSINYENFATTYSHLLKLVCCQNCSPIFTVPPTLGCKYTHIYTLANFVCLLVIGFTRYNCLWFAECNSYVLITCKVFQRSKLALPGTILTLMPRKILPKDKVQSNSSSWSYFLLDILVLQDKSVLCFFHKIKIFLPYMGYRDFKITFSLLIEV